MKPNFKKLALLGITSGLLVSQQVQAESEGVLSVSHKNSCKGEGGCGGSKSSCKGEGGCGGSKSSCKGEGGCGGSKSSCKGEGGCSGVLADNETPEKKSPYVDPAKVGDAKKDPNDGNMNYHLMTEEELLLELNDDGLRMYKSLTAEGKALALKVASGMCAASNQCQGLNACKSANNACAGKGDCAGKGICAISDKNLAVKLVYDKMNEKRKNLTK